MTTKGLKMPEPSTPVLDDLERNKAFIFCTMKDGSVTKITSQEFLWEINGETLKVKGFENDIPREVVSIIHIDKYGFHRIAIEDEQMVWQTINSVFPEQV